MATTTTTNCGCMCSIDMGSFLSCTTTFTLTGLLAEETGTHTLLYYKNGYTFTETFEAVAGVEFTIPNIFPESGNHKFEILNPSGVNFNSVYFLSTCITGTCIDCNTSSCFSIITSLT